MRTLSKTTRLITIPALALLLAAQPAAAGTSVPSTVMLAIAGDTFSGKVSSPAPSCIGGRKVKLIRIDPGFVRTVVSTAKTGSNGRYSTEIPMQSGNAYFARVVRKTVGSVVCRADRSATKTA